ncbi:MAG: ATP synthase F1 subunit delta [Omnitrophica WOR_2 bacterium RIFCSPHIGHO2_02_FULL_68_15]|nr:MAG: ATP synthase F1 subunit delta [Omnitrophica WOR_2 bacterium RIFCSPHIGHO2_02_FULL_68_15]
MLDTAAAGRYAQAWVSLAHRQGALEAGLRDLAAISDLFERQPLLARVLANPEVAVAEKQRLVTRLLEGRVAPAALRLVILLLWKHRLPLLPAIIAQAERLRDQVEGVTRGVVTTARPLPAATLARLQERLAARVGRRLALTAVVEPMLLGGAVVQLGHVVFDGSVRRELDGLRERLITLKV